MESSQYLISPEKRVCVVTGQYGADGHHLYTRKARPDLKNEVWNIIFVSREIHSGFHARGTAFMSNKYPQIKRWLLSMGWQYDDFTKKWKHEKARTNGLIKKIPRTT